MPPAQKKTKPGRVTLERKPRAEMSAKSKVSAPKQSWFVLRTSLYDETETSLPQKNERPTSLYVFSPYCSTRLQTVLYQNQIFKETLPASTCSSDCKFLSGCVGCCVPIALKTIVWNTHVFKLKCVHCGAIRSSGW